MTTKYKRTALTIQLTPGHDDALIGWLEGLESGSRQGVIKAVLIAYASAAGQLETPLTRIEAKLDYLPRLLDEKLAGMAIMQAGGPNGQPSKAMSAERIDRRNDRMTRNASKWD